jgi:hypothetical protein
MISPNPTKLADREQSAKAVRPEAVGSERARYSQAPTARITLSGMRGRPLGSVLLPTAVRLIAFAGSK